MRIILLPFGSWQCPDCKAKNCFTELKAGVWQCDNCTALLDSPEDE